MHDGSESGTWSHRGIVIQQVPMAHILLLFLISHSDD
jgi:hypothetical protein